MATLRGRPYYQIISALKQMDMKYYSVSPQEAAASDAKIIITTHDEASLIANRKGSVIFDTELEKYPAVAKAKILRSIVGEQADDQMVIGIDPGSRIGVSVIYMHEEIASTVESSPAQTVEKISAILAGVSSRKKVVRIGDGNMMMAQQLAWLVKKRFNAVQVEIVDEHGTSQNTEANRRGIRDRSSARTIAFRSGKSFQL
ncbi:MAG: hypothetical protein DA330_01340 [Nitrososphaera sp.]|nr:hypothetical protein [Nitrososphaera sp.]